MNVVFYFNLISISGAFHFHIAISAMLLRPLPTYKRKGKPSPSLSKDQEIQIEILVSPEKLMTIENIDDEGALKFKGKGLDNMGFQGEDEHIENQHSREAITPLPINEEDDTRDAAAKYEQCATSYQVIFTNLAFLRLFVMILLSSFAVFSILYLMPPLAQERGASDVTASLTVTVCGATELVSR